MRVYLMPIAGTGSMADPRRPKYAETHLAGVNFAMMDYGDEPVCLVATDLPAPVHSLLAAEPDVTALPADLTQAVGAQLTVVKNALEALNIPAGWVLSTHTYRQILRVVTLIFQLAQRHQGKGFGRIFTSGVTLDTRFNQLTATARNRLTEVGTSFGFDTSGLTGSSTLRNILKNLADQFTSIEVFLGDNIF